MKWFLITLLLTATPALAATPTECLQWALWKEARGEGILTQRATLDVIEARIEAAGPYANACNVLRKKGQFPYFRFGVKKVDFAFTVRYNVVSKMGRVLSKDYLYFNHVKHPWGRDTKKIGNLYFSK